MPPRRALATLLAAVTALCLPAAASADTFLPPEGKVWHGVTAGDSVGDFTARAGKHPAVWQHFIAWGGDYRYTIRNSAAAGARLMLHLGTAKGQDLPERISPGAIARGEGDGFLVGLGRDLAATGAPVYLRLMAEMNNCHNAYAAYDCGGRRRDADHSPAAFKRAWKRVRLILRGGETAAIDARLARLGLPPVRAGAGRLAAAQVAFVWAPMTGGSPEIAALRPQVYWPGGAWVDWVGTSFYSRFPNWGRLDAYYAAFAVARRKPFAIAEWAIWGADDPAFARRLFAWVRGHGRVRMVQYNQGSLADGPFRLRRYPGAQQAIRRGLSSSRYVAYAPEHG